MLHRHLTREKYELALEESSSTAARYQRQAERCPRCAAALAEPPLAPRLAAWVAPASTRRPAGWEAALRRAIAPSSSNRRREWSRKRRLTAATVVAAAMLLLSAIPAAAEAGPHSVLYPGRSVEENLRWQLTPEPDRATLEADLASAYLWQARSAAVRHDTRAYQAAMQRFFTWAGRLHADIRKAPPAKRSSARAAVRADMSLVSPLRTSGPDPAQARRAESLIGDVETDGDDGQRGGDQQRAGAPSEGAKPDQSGGG
jgi:hypothetical protein